MPHSNLLTWRQWLGLSFFETSMLSIATPSAFGVDGAASNGSISELQRVAAL